MAEGGCKSTEEDDLLQHSIKRAKKLEATRGSGDLGTGFVENKRTFKDALAGGTEEAKEGDEDRGEEEKFIAGNRRFAIGDKGSMLIDFCNSPCPRILITETEFARFRSRWRYSLILKVLWKRTGFNSMHRRLQQLRNLKGEFVLIDLSRFQVHEDGAGVGVSRPPLDSPRPLR